MAARGNVNLATKGSYGMGDKVEVLSSEEGFSDAWATATVVGNIKGSWLVEYSKFVDADAKPLREKVRRVAIAAPPCAALQSRSAPCLVYPQSLDSSRWES